MSDVVLDHGRQALRVVREQIERSAATAKCRACGCLQQTVSALKSTSAGIALAETLQNARAVFEPKKYDCLGCAVCWPAVAANAFGEAFPAEGEALDLCPTAPADERPGWPPLPGEYRIVRYGAPVAVCVLNSERLMSAVTSAAPEGLAIVGTLHTENLGIERLMRNVLANPNLRRLVLCGEDTRQSIGHLPGQSLVSMFENGIDEQGRIQGGRGKRPILKNVSRIQVEAFMRQVELVAMIGESEVPAIAATVEKCARSAPGPFAEAVTDVAIPVLRTAEPVRLVSDPAGYLVVYPDARRRLLLVEHYTNAGALDMVLEGLTPTALYSTIVERGLVSRLDHAAYLGRELARVERCLETGERYVQDRAAGEADADPSDISTSCGCSNPCGDGASR